MSSKGGDLMSQLSGLRLSDGTMAGSRVNGTPPTLSTLSSRTTPTAGSPTSFPPANTTTTTTIASDPLHSRQGNQRRNHRVARQEKESESSSSLAEKINRLMAQNQGSMGNAKESSPATDNGNSIITNLAARYQKSPAPPSSSGNTSTTTFLAPSTPPAATTTTTTATAATPTTTATGAARNSMVVPKPRSTGTNAVHAATTPHPDTATTSGGEALNPKVMEFFNTVSNASRSPPPLADSAAVLKVAVAIAEPHSRASPSSTSTARAAPASSVAAAASPASVRGPARSAAATAPSRPAQREGPDPANRFLMEAFGCIDNLDVTKPIIRTAPQIAADGRYIVVGDLHGCVEQLEQLVEKAKYVKGKDCLFIIGDYVNKGPDSIGVVRACQRLGAYGVLGNHDYTLLRCCARMRRRAFDADDLRDPVKRLAQKFPKDCEYYLRALPHMVRIPRHNLLLVHAGLNVEHALEDQNVEEIMHLRRLEAVANKPGTYKAIAKGMNGEPWGTLWKGPEMVIFGHDAFSGFQSHPHACGIDTGCVYGDPLTCVVYGPDSEAGEFFSVSGLPKLENEMKGLPPPNSDIYEQHETNLEKLIIRPTSRATPAMNGSFGARPVFLAAPLGYTDALEGGAKPTGLTATVTSTNTLMTPTSASPSRLVTPTCVTNVRMLETTTVNTREVQRATLLALSATRELSAISVLLSMPLYNNEIDAMLSADAKDDVAQEAFWIPFARLVLVAATDVSTATDVKQVAAMEAAVQLALDVCEEMEAVGTTLQVDLATFVASAKDHQMWPKRVVKCAETLVD